MKAYGVASLSAALVKLPEHGDESGMAASIQNGTTPVRDEDGYLACMPSRRNEYKRAHGIGLSSHPAAT